MSGLIMGYLAATQGPLLVCCLVAAVILVRGAAGRASVLGAAGALIMACAVIVQIVLSTFPFRESPWWQISIVMALPMAAGLLMLGLAAVWPRPDRTQQPYQESPRS